jgi:hypothetical protein
MNVGKIKKFICLFDETSKINKLKLDLFYIEQEMGFTFTFDFQTLNPKKN